MTLNVLVVCDSGAAVSPMVRSLLEVHLGDCVRVSSAGTRVSTGERVTPESLSISRAWGADAVDHDVQQLDGRALEGADLVLTAGREQRSDVLRLAPAMLHRTFTVREAGRLAVRAAHHIGDADKRDRLDALLRELMTARGRWGGAPSADDDVDDPRGLGDVAYARTAGIIGQAVARLVDAVEPVVVDSPG